MLVFSWRILFKTPSLSFVMISCLCPLSTYLNSGLSVIVASDYIEYWSVEICTGKVASRSPKRQPETKMTRHARKAG